MTYSPLFTRAVFRRTGIAVLAIWLIIGVYRVSFAETYRDGAALSVAAVAPLDGAAMANHAARLAAMSQTKADQAESRDLAMDALEREPTNVVALRALGSLADGAGNRQLAEKYFQLALRLSRRDRGTHLWLIGEHARAGRFDAMVRQADIALKTSTKSWDTLLPILAGAIADDRAMHPIRRAIMKKPDWWLPFAEIVALGSSEPSRAESLLRGLLDPETKEQRIIITGLIRRAVEAGDVALAESIYINASNQMGLDRSSTAIRSGDFESPSVLPPFDWSFTEEPELRASRVPRPDGKPGHALSLIAHNGRSGDLARQILALPPATYTLRFEAGMIPSDRLDRPQVMVTCLGDAPSPTILDLIPDLEGATGVTTADFVVPDGCPRQWLSIRMSGEGPLPVASPWIDNLAISASRA